MFLTNIAPCNIREVSWLGVSTIVGNGMVNIIGANTAALAYFARFCVSAITEIRLL